MATENYVLNEYLKPIDASNLPTSRGRQASSFYPRLIEAFLASEEKAMQVDVERIGRKPATVRSALVKAAKAAGHQDKIRVSLIGGEVFLALRIDARSPEP